MKLFYNENRLLGSYRLSAEGQGLGLKGQMTIEAKSCYA